MIVRNTLLAITHYILDFDDDFSDLLSLLLRCEEEVLPLVPLMRLLPLVGSFRPGPTSEPFESLPPRFLDPLTASFANLSSSSLF